MGWVMTYGVATLIGVAAAVFAGLAGAWVSWAGCALIVAYLYAKWVQAIERWYVTRCSD